MTEPTVKLPSPPPAVDPETQGPISTKPLMSERTRRATIIVGSIVLVVLLIVVVVIGYFMYTSYDRAPSGVVPSTVRLRDISFVVLALETLVIMVLLLVITVLLVAVIILVYDRVLPILEQMNRTITSMADTVQTMRGTSEFLSEKAVTPVIAVSSYASGFVRILQGIRDLWPRRGA